MRQNQIEKEPNLSTSDMKKLEILENERDHDGGTLCKKD